MNKVPLSFAIFSNLCSLFLLLFMGLTVLFSTIYKSYCIISVNFYHYLQYFQQKVFSFSKISRSQTDIIKVWLKNHDCTKGINLQYIHNLIKFIFSNNSINYVYFQTSVISIK